MLGNVYIGEERGAKQSPDTSIFHLCRLWNRTWTVNINWNTGLWNDLSMQVTQHIHPNYSVAYHAKTTCNETFRHAMPQNTITYNYINAAEAMKQFYLYCIANA
jgi:hypothetical protein